jgi:hypothetical protein
MVIMTPVQMAHFTPRIDGLVRIPPKKKTTTNLGQKDPEWTLGT